MPLPSPVKRGRVGWGRNLDSRKTMPWLESYNLNLRPFTLDDLDRFHDRIMGNEKVARYLESGGVLPRARTERLLERIIDHWSYQGYGIWAVEHKAEGFFIGYCGLRDITNPEGIELAFATDHQYWSKGFTTEAAAVTLRYAFEQKQFPRIVSLISKSNKPAQRIMQKLQMDPRREVKHFGLKMTLYEARRRDFDPRPISEYVLHKD